MNSSIAIHVHPSGYRARALFRRRQRGPRAGPGETVSLARGPLGTRPGRSTAVSNRGGLTSVVAAPRRQVERRRCWRSRCRCRWYCRRRRVGLGPSGRVVVVALRGWSAWSRSSSRPGCLRLASWWWSSSWRPASWPPSSTCGPCWWSGRETGLTSTSTSTPPGISPRTWFTRTLPRPASSPYVENAVDSTSAKSDCAFVGHS